MGAWGVRAKRQMFPSPAVREKAPERRLFTADTPSDRRCNHAAETAFDRKDLATVKRATLIKKTRKIEKFDLSLIKSGRGSVVGVNGEGWAVLLSRAV